MVETGIPSEVRFNQFLVIFDTFLEPNALTLLSLGAYILRLEVSEFRHFEAVLDSF